MATLAEKAESYLGKFRPLIAPSLVAQKFRQFSSELSRWKGPLGLLLLLLSTPMLYEALENQWARDWQATTFPKVDTIKALFRIEGYRPVENAKTLSQLNRQGVIHASYALEFWTSEDFQWIRYAPINPGTNSEWSDEWIWMTRIPESVDSKVIRQLQWRFLAQGWKGLELALQEARKHPLKSSPGAHQKATARSILQQNTWLDPRSIRY